MSPVRLRLTRNIPLNALADDSGLRECVAASPASHTLAWLVLRYNQVVKDPLENDSSRLRGHRVGCAHRPSDSRFVVFCPVSDWALLILRVSVRGVNRQAKIFGKNSPAPNPPSQKPAHATARAHRKSLPILILRSAPVKTDALLFLDSSPEFPQTPHRSAAPQRRPSTTRASAIINGNLPISKPYATASRPLRVGKTAKTLNRAPPFPTGKNSAMSMSAPPSI